MDDNNLNHLIGARDAAKWVDGFLTVVPDADRDLMLTWFACAIESGRMTVQGEHEQDGEDTGVVGDSALSGESVRGVASMLAEFHAHPNADEATNSRELRYVLHVEEAAELADELDHEDDGEWDREKIARELADVVYVAYGTAHVFDIDLDVALAEIHRAAMRKLDANVRRADGKIVKPPGFVPPDMSGALRDVSWRAEWLPSGCGETAQDGDTEETT